jgi:hypothetical protein
VRSITDIASVLITPSRLTTMAMMTMALNMLNVRLISSLTSSLASAADCISRFGYFRSRSVASCAWPRGRIARLDRELGRLVVAVDALHRVEFRGPKSRLLGRTQAGADRRNVAFAGLLL